MSPEQLKGANVDGRSDIYNLGKTIWETLIGEVPRVGTPLPGKLMKGKIAHEIDALIAKCVEHKPENRYQTANEALRAVNVGELNIRARKDFESAFKRYSKIAIFITVIVCIVGIGSYVIEMNARGEIDIALEKNKESPNKCRRALKSIQAKSIIFGTSYLAKKDAELNGAIEDERKRMLSEFSSIQERLQSSSSIPGDKATLCSNFSRKWSDVFIDNNEVKIMNERSAYYFCLKSCEDASAMATAGNIKQALEGLDLAIKESGSLSEDGRSRIQLKRSVIINAFAGPRIIDIAKKTEACKDDFAKLQSLQGEIASLISLVGKIPEVTAVQL